MYASEADSGYIMINYHRLGVFVAWFNLTNTEVQRILSQCRVSSNLTEIWLKKKERKIAGNYPAINYSEKIS